MLDRFVRAHGIALAACAFQAYHDLKAMSAGAAAVVEGLAEASRRYPQFLESSPRAMIHALASTPRDKAPRSLAAWCDRAQDTLKLTGTGDVRAAASIAHVLLRAPSARRVFGFAAELRRCPEPRDLAVGFRAVDALRHPASHTGARVEAVSMLSAQFPDDNIVWAQVCNVLYQQIFAWPLLVVPGADGAAVSVPVGIDVHLDGGPPVTLLPERPAHVKFGPGHTSRKPSLADYRRIVDVAKAMWEDKHRNYGREFRQKIRHAGVVFDFSGLEAIAAAAAVDVDLADVRSMQPYLVQVVLSQLLGAMPVFGNVSTAVIGAARGPTGNYDLVWPGGVGKKLALALKAHAVERLILPRPPENDAATHRAEVSSALRDGQTAELNYVATLYNMADVMQSYGWRQFRYVRCPDVGWLLHRRDKRALREITPGVRSVIAALRGNPSALLRLPASTPADVAAALWQTNIGSRAEVGRSGQRPMASWTFVRVVPNELDEVFWCTVWQAIGADYASFDRFVTSATANDAAAVLAEQLNRFVPSERFRRGRTPDVLVIVASARLRDGPRRDLIRHPHFAIESVARHLAPMLQPSHLADLLGHTRIVFVEKDDVAGGPGAVPSPDVADVVDRLSYFRFGFTQQQAAAVLSKGTPGPVLRQLLNRLWGDGILREFEGAYFVPSAVTSLARNASANDETAALSRDEHVNRAQRFYDAAIATAPYLFAASGRSLTLDRALQQQHVHEANHLLMLGIRHAARGRDVSLERKSRRALHRIEKYVHYPMWDLLDRVNRSGSTLLACTVCEELLDDARRAGQALTPGRLVSAARTLAAGPHAVRDGRVVALYENALHACGKFPNSDYNRLLVTTHYWLFLHKQPTRDSVRLDQLRADAFRLLDAGVDGAAAFGEWYEAIGDLEIDHERARDVYALGMRWVPDWNQLWIKRVGAAAARWRVKRPPAVLVHAGRARVASVLHFSRTPFGTAMADPRTPHHVRERWVRGLAVFEMMAGDAAVAREFARYPRGVVALA